MGALLSAIGHLSRVFANENIDTWPQIDLSKEQYKYKFATEHALVHWVIDVL